MTSLKEKQNRPTMKVNGCFTKHSSEYLPLCSTEKKTQWGLERVEEEKMVTECSFLGDCPFKSISQ